MRVRVTLTDASPGGRYHASASTLRHRFTVPPVEYHRMFEEFDTGDVVEITYHSDRSGGTVSRTGSVLQTPDENGKRGLFVRTDDDQLTGVMGDRVYSLSLGEEDGERTVQRQTYLGDLEAVSPSG